MKAITASILFATFTYAFFQSADWKDSTVGLVFCMIAFILGIVFFFVTLKYLFKNE